MRVAIYGSGGTGGYFGGRLAQAGHDVVFIARGDHLKALQREGLRVESVRGDFHLHPVNATDDPAQVGEVDAVLLGVKTWQVREASVAIQPLLGPRTPVISMQNGVEAPRILAEGVGRERVLPGLVKIFSHLSAPGHIRHVGGPASIAFAEWSNEPTERVNRLRQAFGEAGITVEVPQDIQAALWSKFLFVVPVGGVGTVARAPVGIIRSVPETRRLLEESMEEILQVARAHGIRLPDDVVERSLEFVDSQPAAGTSSLHRDITSGRPSELEAWSGAVVRLGEEVGVATPVNRVIYHSLLPVERRARGELDFAV